MQVADAEGTTNTLKTTFSRIPFLTAGDRPYLDPHLGLQLCEAGMEDGGWRLSISQFSSKISLVKYDLPILDHHNLPPVSWTPKDFLCQYLSLRRCLDLYSLLLTHRIIMRRYDKTFRPPRPSEFPLSQAASAVTFNINGRRFSIPLSLLQSTPSVFRSAGPYASPRTIHNLVKILEQSATGLAAFDAVFGPLVFGYSDTTKIGYVETDQLDYSEATLRNENTEQEVPFEEQEFPTVILHFDLLVDAIALAEAIEAHTVADILYKEFRSVFCNVILTKAQVQKLFGSGRRMKAFLLEHIFGFKVTEKPPELFVEHLDNMIEAILHVPGLIDYVSSKLRQYSISGWSAAIADPIRKEVAEHREAKAREQQDQIRKYMTPTDKENESEPHRRGESPNQKRAKTGNASFGAEEEPHGEHQFLEVDNVPDTPPDASRPRDSGTDWDAGDLDLPTTQASATEAANSNDQNAISTHGPLTRGKSGAMTRSEKAAWAEDIARAPTPPSIFFETGLSPAPPAFGSEKNYDAQHTDKTAMNTTAASAAVPTSLAMTNSEPTTPPQPAIEELIATDGHTLSRPPAVPTSQQTTTARPPVPPALPPVPAPPPITALTQTAPAAPAPLPSPWTRGSHLRERAGNWKDKMTSNEGPLGTGRVIISKKSRGERVSKQRSEDVKAEIRRYQGCSQKLLEQTS